MRTPSAVPASLAAVASVLAASSCCLPIATMWLAATAAGASAFLAAARPYLMTLSVGLIAFGFWQARRARACRPRTRWLSLTLLFFATLFVGASLLAPQVLANWMAGGRSRVAELKQPPLANIRPDSIDIIRTRWNSSSDCVPVLILLSPT